MREIQYQSMQYRSDRNIVSYYSFAGGIFDTENADRVADNEVSDMINLDIVNDGSHIYQSEEQFKEVILKISNYIKNYDKPKILKKDK